MSSGSPQSLKVTNNVAYILTERFLYSLSESKIIAEAEVSNARSLDINENTKEIYIGNMVKYINSGWRNPYIRF